MSACPGCNFPIQVEWDICRRCGWKLPLDLREPDPRLPTVPPLPRRNGVTRPPVTGSAPAARPSRPPNAAVAPRVATTGRDDTLLPARTPVADTLLPTSHPPAPELVPARSRLHPAVASLVERFRSLQLHTHWPVVTKRRT